MAEDSLRPRGRRQTRVLRNLDEPLKLLGLLTTRSCGLLLIFYTAAYLIDLVLGVWTWVFGDLALVGQIGATIVLGFVLAFVERHEDEHHVPAAIVYHLQRPWRWVYSGAGHDSFHKHQYPWLLPRVPKGRSR